MKMKTTALLTTLTLGSFGMMALPALSTPAHAAEVKLPQPSPAAKVALTVGLTDVEIAYHRPGVKGRAIWGGLVPWDKVWRLGANDATTITFASPVKVDGHDVPAGTYGLFAIPGKDKWTLILNRNSKQWGAYSYKQEEDLLRFDVKPQAGADTEWMVFTLSPATPGSAVVEMAWEKVRVSFTIATDADKLAWQSIDEVLAGKPDAEAYLTAAYFAVEKNTRLAEARTWVDKALALEENFWGHEYKAKLLQKEGKVAEAVQHLDKAMQLAKGKAPQEYIDNLGKLKAEWQKAA